MPSVAHIIRRRRNRKQRQQDDQTRSRFWSGFIIAVLASMILIPVIVILGLAGLLYGQAISAMPSPADTIYLDPIVGNTELYDRSSNVLLYSVSDPLGNQRDWVDIEALPDYVVDATVQMEDADFLASNGPDVVTTLERMWRYILGIGNRRDTSIGARLVRKALVSPARDASGLDTEVLEVALTADVHRQYAPRRVLEWYLNTNYYGNDAYGIEAAAQVYFGKSAAELTLSESALLAAIPPAPQFNPFDNPTAADGRRVDLLRQMHNNSMISQADFDTASATLPRLRQDLAAAPLVAPAFSVYAREQTENILNRQGLDGDRLVSRGGLTVTTSLDVDLYYQSECTLRAHIAQLQGRARPTTTLHGQPCVATDYLRDLISPDTSQPPENGSLLLLDASSGEIRSMVGRATRTAHQPGLTLQPFVYFTGFRNGNFHSASMLLDIPRSFPGASDGLIYPPSNPDGEYRGPLNLRDAMAAYLRTPAAFVADTEGIWQVLSDAHQLGLNSLQDTTRYDLSLLQNGGAVSLLDLTYAYSVFATQGIMRGVDAEPVARNFRARNPVAVLKIEDSEGNVLWQYDDEQKALSRTTIIEQDLAYLVNDILADSQTRSDVLNINADTLSLDRPAAVVNGLTQDRTESWTIGYTPQLVGGVHLNRSDDSGMSLDVHSLQGAAPVWQALMQHAHRTYNYQAAQWNRPEGITEYVVCDKSGLIPSDDNPCPTRTDLFLSRVYPTQQDTYWRQVEENSQRGTLATTYTPENLIIERLYFVPPDAAMDWWQSNNQPLPPTNYDTVSAPGALSSVQIFLPQQLARVGGEVDIRGSINTEGMQFYQLAYGEGINPARWFEIGEEQESFTDGQSLGTWDTSNLDGIYTLELAVTYADNRRESDYVSVTVDNIPPTIDLQTGDNPDGENQTIYRFPSDNSVRVTANVDDNLGIERVEFYQNGTLLGIDDEPPYQFTHDIDGTGTQVFSATVFDRVGNSASDDVQIEVIRSGGSSTGN